MSSINPEQFASDYLTNNKDKCVTIDMLALAYFQGSMKPTADEIDGAKFGFKYLISKGVLKQDENGCLSVVSLSTSSTF